MSVHKKLMESRIRLQSTKLSKSGKNAYAGYEYFELGDFLPQTMQIFNELGLCGIISFTAETASLTITDTESNTSIIITSPMAAASLKGCHEVQNLGASQTYLRRYLWVAAMEIVEHDALDATTSKENPRTKSVTVDIWDKMPENEQRRLQGIADAVRSFIESDNMQDALLILSEVSDVDEKTALWSRFDSKERSAIKKASKGE